MDEAQRKELQESKDKIFFVLMAECRTQADTMRSLLEVLKADAQSGLPLSVQKSTDYCNETEDAMHKLYAALDTEIPRLKQISAQLKGDDSDDAQANLSLPVKK